MSGKGKYNLQDLRDMTEDTITPAIAGDVLGCTGHLLGRMCHDNPEKVQFPFVCIGNRTIIMREGFIRWAEGKSGEPLVVRPGDMILVPGSGPVMV